MTDVALRPETEAVEPPAGSAPPPSRRERWAWRAFWAGIAACVIYCILVRLWGPRGLWLDEAQSVAIARLPLSGGHGITLYQALKQDGSPPLYYLLLHGWIALFGDGDRTVRALSFVLNLACIPPLLVLGRRVIGRRAAWVAVLAFITSPFAAYYASETRMYSLLALLAILGGLALERTLRAPSRWSVLCVSLASVAMALTHYWALYSLATVALFLLIGLWRGTPPVQRGCKRALAGLAGGAILFIAWLPTLLYQSKHTGTSWGPPTTYADVVHAVGQWSGGQSTAGRALLLVVCALLALAIFGYPAGKLLVRLDLGGHEPGRLLFLVSIVPLLLAATVSQLVGNAWFDRYNRGGLHPLPALFRAGAGTARRQTAMGGLHRTARTLRVRRGRPGRHPAAHPSGAGGPDPGGPRQAGRCGALLPRPARTRGRPRGEGRTQRTGPEVLHDPAPDVARPGRLARLQGT